jgi:hypothetical protein
MAVDPPLGYPLTAMKNDIQSPDDGRLRTLLHEARPAPSLPPRFQKAVWRRIKSAEAPAILPPSPFAWLEQWVERLLLPRFALASLALLLVAGGLMGVMNSADAATQQAKARYLSVVAPNPIH